jgi:hypothetical protein
MLGAVPQLDGALGVVAIFHQLTADALARSVSALPIMPLNAAVVSMAHYFLRLGIAIVNATF